MRTSATLGLFLFAWLSAVDAGADPFSFEAAFTTRGFFSCVPNVACTGSGTNTVTLGSGAGMATLTFTGVDTTIQVDNTARPVSLGSIESSASSGFTFPTRTNRNVPILRFNFSIELDSPVANTRTKHWTFGPGGGTELPLLMGGTHSIFPTGQPPGANYRSFVFTFWSDPPGFRIPSNGVMEIGADVGAVPEPATLLLLGAGLAGAYVRTRKRSPAAAR